VELQYPGLVANTYHIFIFQMVCGPTNMLWWNICMHVWSRGVLFQGGLHDAVRRYAFGSLAESSFGTV
jgi:hypothetical protein